MYSKCSQGETKCATEFAMNVIETGMNAPPACTELPGMALSTWDQIIPVLNNLSAVARYPGGMLSCKPQI